MGCLTSSCLKPLWTEVVRLVHFRCVTVEAQLGMAGQDYLSEVLNGFWQVPQRFQCSSQQVMSLQATPSSVAKAVAVNCFVSMFFLNLFVLLDVKTHWYHMRPAS